MMNSDNIIKKAFVYCICFVFIGISTVTGEESFVEIISHDTDMDVETVTVDHEVWQSVEPYRQPLQPQFLVEPKPAEIGVKEVLVQSIHDDRFISFRLSWKDATRDDTPKIMGFSDGAAIQFPLRSDVLPEFFMGDAENPVHILYWRAWRSKDKEAGFQTVESAYPYMTADIHTFDYPVAGQGTEKTPEEKSMFVPGVAAGNPLSSPTPQVITELTATGTGTIGWKPTADTFGDAHWEDGVWAVVFTRPLTVPDEGTVRFAVGNRTPVVFAIWEGGRMEAGSRKAVSPAWAEVEIE